MNDIDKAVEEILFNYNKYKAEIENWKLAITEINNNYSTLSAIQYDRDNISKTYKFNSEVENKVMDISDYDLASKIKYFQNKKKSSEIIVKRIEIALGILTDREQKIVEMKYFKKMRNRDIAFKLDLSEEYISELKSGIVKRLSKLLILRKF